VLKHKPITFISPYRSVPCHCRIPRVFADDPYGCHLCGHVLGYAPASTRALARALAERLMA
jgi:hypothetical protein